MAYTAKSSAPKPPLKGAFPLDHEAECRPFQVLYMTCLAEHDYVATRCRQQSLQYLECRMQRQLMAEENVASLGFDPKSVERVEDFNRRLDRGEIKIKKNNSSMSK